MIFSKICNLRRSFSLNRGGGRNGEGPDGLALIDLLASELSEYHLLHAARADLLRRMGSRREAAESYERATTAGHERK